MQKKKKNDEKRDSFYLDHFMNCGGLLNLLKLRIFNDTNIHKPVAKEVSESMGASMALKLCIGKELWKTTRLAVVVVGDGTTPKTASIIALRTRATVFSVDPIMKEKDGYPEIRGLIAINGSIGGDNPVSFEFSKENFDRVVIIHPHSHAKLSDSLDSIIADCQRSLISIPCCVKSDIEKEPDFVYTDNKIFSLENTVMIWKDI